MGPPLPASPPRPSPGRWWWVAGVSGLLVAVIAATAAITYAAAHQESSSPAEPVASPAGTESPRQYSPAEQAAAKDRLCHIFDESTTDLGSGAVREHGELNVPLVLRIVDSIVAVRNSLTPATPPEVDAAAKTYIDTSLEVTTAAMGETSTAEVNRLNDIANTATDALSDVCGLPH